MAAVLSQDDRNRRGVALILVVLLIALLSATAAQLATLAGTRAIVTARRTNTLQHRLAVDSAIHLLAMAMAENDAIDECLDRNQQVAGEFQLGECKINWIMRDDGAKFNVLPFDDKRMVAVLRRKLEELGHLYRLPELRIQPRPIADRRPNRGEHSPRTHGTGRDRKAFATFDQLFETSQSVYIFHWQVPGQHDQVMPVWSDYVSLFGDGRIDLRRADPQIVNLALRDIQADLVPDEFAESNLTNVLDSLDSSVRPQVAARLGYDLNRYAITLYTAIGSDTRRWYVVATLSKSAAEVHHRQQITW